MRHLLLISILALAGCSNDANNDANNANNVAADSGGETDTADNSKSDGGASDTGTTPDTGGADTGGSDAAMTDSGTATDSGTDSGTMVDMSVAPSPCPDSLGEATGACTLADLECEYGDDPREACRPRAVCTDGSWAITTPRCTALPDVTCPATREDASGELCQPMDAYCDYDGLVCHCTNCIDGPVIQCAGEPDWKCAVPNADAECPAAKPRLGETCTVDLKECEYKCGPGNARTCTDGTWHSSDGGPCPISTAKVKRDIRYLSSKELAEVSAAVQAIPLAHWQYTDPAYGRGEKLGFIIEDLPTSTPAVDRDRLMVDLYGYTSMLVADAQAREKQMKTLEQRLSELEKKTVQCDK